MSAASDNNATILLAEDNDDIRRLVSARLKRRGYTVLTAVNGGEAKEIIDQSPLSAAVLDWVMPEISGKDLCEMIKDDPATCKLPVVLLTARAAEADVEGGFAAGADEYLTKPFDVDELDEILQRLIASQG